MAFKVLIFSLKYFVKYGCTEMMQKNSKLLYFPVLFHISILIILLPTAGMVKPQFESFFEAI